MGLPAAAEAALLALEKRGAEASVKIDQAVEAVEVVVSDGVVRATAQEAATASVVGTPPEGSLTPRRGRG